MRSLFLGFMMTTIALICFYDTAVLSAHTDYSLSMLNGRPAFGFLYQSTIISVTIAAGFAIFYAKIMRRYRGDTAQPKMPQLLFEKAWLRPSIYASTRDT